MERQGGWNGREGKGVGENQGGWGSKTGACGARRACRVSVGRGEVARAGQVMFVVIENGSLPGFCLFVGKHKVMTFD